MSRATLEVGDIFRIHDQAFDEQYGGSVSPEQWKVVRAVKHCRTKVLGGHVEQCGACGHQRIAYNSCRNRHCPKCQSGARAAWVAEREQELLPVPYFHVVFTIPDSLSSLALQNKALVYGILFKAAAETLKEVAANPKHLGAKIGFLSILHTWGQNLMFHPHLHCVVPGGGISCDGESWVHCRRSKRNKKAFFLPVRVLSRVFRGKFIDALKRAFTGQRLVLLNQIAHLNNPREFDKFLNLCVRKDWVVFAKRPFGGPAQVLKYLARYTHRVAISNHRLVSMVGDRVTFRWKDYADGNQGKQMTLRAGEFMRRFLLHTLPRGFTRIRHFGFLANRNRKANLETCRRLLPVTTTDKTTSSETTKTDPPDAFPQCPRCSTGEMFVVEFLPNDRCPIPKSHLSWHSHLSPQGVDTS